MKKKVLVLILSILAVLLCITACSRDDDGENNDDLVKSIEVIQGSYPVSCEVGETPDFSGL